MSVPADTASFIEYDGNASASTAYSIPFTFYAAATDLVVYLDGVATTDYTVTGSNLKTDTALPATSKILIVRALPITQTLDLVEGESMPSASIELALDRIALSQQEQRTSIARAPAYPHEETAKVLPTVSNRASKFVHWDSSGDIEEYTPAQVAADIKTDLGLAALVSAFVTVTTANASSRGSLAPTFTGQLLLQLDNYSLWQSTGTSAGNWAAPVYLRGTTAGITASTNQTQGQGALTTDFNEVSTVGSTNDTVTLPIAVAGREVFVINNGGNTLKIFPAYGDNLGAGANTAATLAAGSNVVYRAYNATNWE